MINVSIKTKIALIVSVLFVFIISVIAYVTFSYFKRQLSESIANQQFALVSEMAGDIDDKILDTHRLLIDESKTVPLSALRSPDRLQAFLDNQFALRAIFDNGIFVFSNSGKLIAESPFLPDRRGRDYSFREYFQRTIQTAQPYISEPYFSSQQHGHPAIVFTAPILDRKNRIAAVLLGSLDLTKHNFLGKMGDVKIGNTGYLFLYNTDRLMIMHPERQRILVKDVPPGANKLFDKAIAGFEGTGETVNSRGFPMLASFKRLRAKNWILAANYPLEEAYAPIDKARRYFLTGTSLGIIVVLPVIWLFLRYAINPLLLFTKHVREFPQKKGLDRYFPAHPRDEIGTLAGTFNKMVEELDKQGEALRESSVLYRTVVDFASDMAFLRSKDGAVLYISPNCRRITGYGEKEFQAMPGLLDTIVHPDDRDIWHAHTKREQEVNPEPLEVRIITKTGDIRWVSHLCRPVHDETAAFEGIRGSHSDITERKRIEETLRRQHAYLTALHETTVGLISRLELDDLLKSIIQRAGALVGTPHGFVYLLSGDGTEMQRRIATGVCEQFSPYALKRGEGLTGAVWQAGKALAVVDYHLWKGHVSWEGRDVVRAIVGVPLKSKDQVIGVVGLTHLEENRTFGEEEITVLTQFAELVSIALDNARLYTEIQQELAERKRVEKERASLEAQLRHAQKMEAVGQLAGGIAHDFNNILTAILGYAHLMVMKTEGHDPVRHYAEQILLSSERAAGLTQSLLAFSRKQFLNLEPVEVNGIIRDVVRLLVRLVGEDIAIKTVLAEQDLTVLADRGQVEQILMNLVTNARDAMPTGGSIVIATDRFELTEEFKSTHGYGKPGHYAFISVEDTGVGMSEGVRDRVFEPFFTTKEVGRGTGLGLSIVYGIVKQHRGYINVQSEPGKGTAFTLYLPLTHTTTGDLHRKEPQDARGGTEEILIAEDDQEVRRLTKSVLEEFGYRVREAVDGEDALRKFTEGRDTIKLLLFDVIMPKKNGKEAFEEIRKINPSVKSIFMSGYSADIVQDRGTLGQGVTFIAKPVSPENLLRTIREVLDT